MTFILKDIWATLDEVKEANSRRLLIPKTYKRLYREFAEQNPLWNEIPTLQERFTNGMKIRHIFRSRLILKISRWKRSKFSNIEGARALAIFGGSVTTDHISPAGAIKSTSPAGLYLQEHGVRAGRL